MAIQLNAVDELTDPAGLSTLFGAVQTVERGPLLELGRSGALHQRLTVRLQTGAEIPLVLKRVRPASDWTAYRTGDRLGREAALLAEPALAGIWDIFFCPYVAFARADGEVGLLMHDLGKYLRPAAEPLTAEDEDRFLGALAALHARYWNAEALQLPWLAAPAARFAILGPRAGEEELQRRENGAPGVPGLHAHPLFRSVRRGWDVALRRVPPAVRAMLLRSPDEIAAAHARLPATLLHGDAKIGNVAFLADGSVAAFDWAGMGTGPATLDLGYYLAVDAPRLARSREGVMARYRSLLEWELRGVISEPLWQELEAIAVLGGALMLLWSKALALEQGSGEAEEEWSWWLRRLQLQAS